MANKIIKPPKNQDKIEIEKENMKIQDDKEIARLFNKFFVEKIEGLMKNIKKEEKENPLRRLGEVLKETRPSLELKTVSEEEVESIIKKLKPKKSSGPDEISAELLKAAGKVIITPLTFIINKSINESTFPTEWKQAIVHPIFKNKGSTKELKQYRPVSLLSVPGMVLERAVGIQIEQFFENNKLLQTFQFGFRKKRSTITAVATMNAMIMEGIRQNKKVAALFYDLSAAFDTINHETLCQKMEMYGLTKRSVKWIRSYLTNRRQKVKVRGEISEDTELKIGTPQGSRLSPLLFSIIMSDMHLWIKHGKLVNFADDTSLVIEADNEKQLENYLEEDSKGIIKFMSSNNLVINPEKTEFLKFKQKPGEETKIMVGKDTVISTTNAKLLGIHIGTDLTWKEHIGKLKGKLRSSLGLLKRLSYKMPSKYLKPVAEATFNSQLRYGIAIYNKPNLKANNQEIKLNQVTEELQILQNKMFRTILGYKITDRISREQLLEESGMKSVNQMTCLHLLTEVNNILYNNTSETLREILTQNHKTNRISTRADNMGLLKIPVIASKGNDFTVSACQIWNGILSANPSFSEGATIKEIIDGVNNQPSSKANKDKLMELFNKLIMEAALST